MERYYCWSFLHSCTQQILADTTPARNNFLTPTSLSCLCFVQSRYLFQITLLQPWQRFLLFLQFFVFSTVYPPNFEHPHHTASALSIPFSRICAPPLHAVGSVILCKSPALPSALLIICATFLLMPLLHLSLLIFFSFLQPLIPLLHGVFTSWMDPRFLTVSRQQLRNPPSAFCVHSSFRSDFLCQIFHNHRC